MLRRVAAAVVAAFLTMTMIPGVARPAQAAGSVFYVATWGSDSASGSSSSPWRTIQNSLDRLQAGDTLIVRGGTYKERVKLYSSQVTPGTATAPVVVKAANGERPVVEGILWLQGASYWTLDGINVTWGSSNSANEHMVKMLAGTGWRLTNGEIWGAKSYAGLLIGQTATNFRVDHNYIHHTYAANSLNQDHLIYVDNGHDGSGVIERNVLAHSPNGRGVKLGPGDLSLPGTDNIVIRYNTFFANEGPANVQFSGSSSNNTVERNIMVRPKSGYDNVSQWNLTGIDNLVKDNIGWEATDLADWGGGIVNGGGNSLVDPVFTDPANGDYSPTNPDAEAYGHTAGASGSGDPFEFAGRQLAATTQRIATSAYPVYTGSDGAWVTQNAASWPSGFFPGALWLMYEHTADPVWKTRAESWQAGVEAQKNDTSTHDVGFQIFNSFGNGYRLTGNDTYREIVLTAAGSLAARFDDVVGATRSWGSISDTTSFKVIVDNMMNLELLLWASQHGGDAAWYDMAVSHALRTRADHVRPDGSTWQIVNYDQTTGAVLDKSTKQGYSDSSTWSRGQAWALSGFAMTYGYTRDVRFLETARATADYFIANLPSDRVPYWDFQLPTTDGQPKDSSAAAIAAAGLLQLSDLETDAGNEQRYFDTARDIIAALSSPAYLAEGTTNHAVLLHGTSNKPSGNYDTGLAWGDYYFVQALQRYEDLVAGTGTNSEPVAAFLEACTDLTCAFTDGSTDADGTIVSRAWNFGDGTTSTATSPTHTYAAGGTYTVTLTATDDDGATASTSRSVTVSAPLTSPEPSYVDDVATGETHNAGTVSGTYADTHKCDLAVETIQETHSGGKPKTRTSMLDHTWTLRVTGGDRVDLYVDASATYAGDGETFRFAWSTDGVSFTTLFDLSAGPNAGQYYSAALPAGTNGTVYVRVRDTDRTAGRLGYDTVHIDHLFVRSANGSVGEPTAPDLGDAGIALAVSGYKVKGMQMADLTWSGATTATVAVMRDGAEIAATPNDGGHTDDIGAKGGGSYRYKVCDVDATTGAATSRCSSEVTVSF